MAHGNAKAGDCFARSLLLHTFVLSGVGETLASAHMCYTSGLF